MHLTVHQITAASIFAIEYLNNVDLTWVRRSARIWLLWMLLCK